MEDIYVLTKQAKHPEMANAFVILNSKRAPVQGDQVLYLEAAAAQDRINGDPYRQLSI